MGLLRQKLGELTKTGLSLMLECFCKSSNLSWARHCLLILGGRFSVRMSSRLILLRQPMTSILVLGWSHRTLMSSLQAFLNLKENFQSSRLRICQCSTAAEHFSSMPSSSSSLSRIRHCNTSPSSLCDTCKKLNIF